jgi:hypothetical protein
MAIIKVYLHVLDPDISSTYIPYCGTPMVSAIDATPSMTTLATALAAPPITPLGTIMSASGLRLHALLAAVPFEGERECVLTALHLHFYDGEGCVNCHTANVRY